MRCHFAAVCLFFAISSATPAQTQPTESLHLDPLVLGPATVGDNVDFNYRATGGVPPYTYGFVSGALPLGLLLHFNSGKIEGTITEAGTYAYTVSVKDAAGATAQAPMSFIVNAPAVISRENIVWGFKGRAGLWVSRVAMLTAEWGDYYTTVHDCIDLPGHVCVEKNPAVIAVANPETVDGRKRFLGLKIGIPLGFIVGQEIYRRFHPISDKTLILSNWVVTAVQTGVDGWNATLPDRIMVPKTK